MRVLFLCHAHPELQAGGTEIFAHALFRGLRSRGVEGLFVAGTYAAQRPPSPGAAFQAVGSQADEMLLWTASFDPFFQSQIDLYGTAPELAALLRDLRPDVVHIHHLLTLGVELVGLIRRVVPDARIVMTLHDYYALCARDGQMVTSDGRLCHLPSQDACRKCFPERGLTDFRLRKLHLDGAFRQIDRFIAPSQFLRARFVAAGHNPDRIVVVPNGIVPQEAVPARLSDTGRRDRFGFFGHINPFKGAIVALAASSRLSGTGVAHALTLHGGNAHQTPAFLTTFSAACEAAPDARYGGAYAHADLARLMAHIDWVVVPSVWWENAPLVIQEAFLHRRPVICADIGGMAEMVRDGIDGLHAAAGDPASFARVLERAATSAELWSTLAGNIVAPVTIQASVSSHLALYAELTNQVRNAA